MTVQPPDLPPRDPTPEERELGRRSRMGALAPWLIPAVLALAGVFAFVLFALRG